MNFLKRLVNRCAAAWWRVLLLFGANITALNTLFWLENRFTTLTGEPVFDTQNDLTTARLLEQLPLYTGDAQLAYYAFAAFDFLFPFIGALSLGTLISWLLKQNPAPLATRLLALNIPLIPFLTTVFDWLENVALLASIWLSSTAPAVIFDLAIVAKRLKLASLGATAALVIFVLVFTIISAFRAWRRRAVP